jgi:hypothetical protein
VSECDVKRIVEELVGSRRDDEIVVLLFMHAHASEAVLFSAVQLALGGGRYYASAKVTRAVLHSLIEKGLVRELYVTYYKKRIRVYVLTDCGMKVARVLSEIFRV